jgi:hypothetical protein
VTPKRYNKIFPKIQSIRGFHGNKCSFQRWFWNLSSISGLSQFWNAWKLPRITKKPRILWILGNIFLYLFWVTQLGHFQCFWKIYWRESQSPDVISSWKSLKKAEFSLRKDNGRFFVGLCYYCIYFAKILLIYPVLCCFVVRISITRENIFIVLFLFLN